jgi:hypothetical protein
MIVLVACLSLLGVVVVVVVVVVVPVFGDCFAPHDAGELSPTLTDIKVRVLDTDASYISIQKRHLRDRNM